MPLVSTVRLRERLSGGRSSLPWEFPEHRSEASLGGGAVAVRKAGMEGLTRVDGGCGICRRGIGCGSRGGSCGFPFHGFAQKSGQFQPYAFAEFMKGQRILYQILDESSHRGVPPLPMTTTLSNFNPLMAPDWSSTILVSCSVTSRLEAASEEPAAWTIC